MLRARDSKNCLARVQMHEMEQVTQLVVTEVRSESFGLVIERRHHNARPISAARFYVCMLYYSSGRPYVAQVLFFVVQYGIARFLCALCAYSTFGHHLHPIGYPCTKFRFFRAPTAQLVRGEKSRTQSLTQTPSHSIIHPAYLICRKPKLSLRNMSADNVQILLVNKAKKL